MRMWRTLPIVLALTCATIVAPLRAEVLDPFDPFDTSIEMNEDEDREKSAEQLLLEGTVLLEQERLLDGRTKLLRALKKDPTSYRAHMMLASYYSMHVGHYRLALKYVRQAKALFEQQHGAPPYHDPVRQREHAHLLYLLSQVRLDLDNYQGALDVLDEFSSYGYFYSWYPGSRAWILMKLGRLDEAIKVARLGIIAGAEPGRTLNMLGILLSMKDEREAALQVFRDAITYEFSLGSMGQPATPLNNSGEVYREMFQEDRAEASWLRATSLPDGCQHVLPSLNLALLYFDQLNLSGAKRTIDNFESCVAQYPLRNGEEHRALVHLARGRIDLLSGRIEGAVAHFEEAVQRRQWFGKIGTSEEDLAAGANFSLAQALEYRANIRSRTLHDGVIAKLEALRAQTYDRLRAWWLKRRVRQILSEELSDFEDLTVRNTDSMLEYPTLGSLLRGFPKRPILDRIAREEQRDPRPEARPFYLLYRAERLLEAGALTEARALLGEVLHLVRPRYDDLLRAHALALRMQLSTPGGSEYNVLAVELFKLNRAHLRNHGLALPAQFRGAEEARSALDGSMFLVVDDEQVPFSLQASPAEGSWELRFTAQGSTLGTVTVRGEALSEAINQLSSEVFSLILK